MKKLIHWIGAIALVLVPSLAIAQSPIVGKSVAAPAGFLPTIAIYCDDGTGHAAICSFASGGGGGGTGDASASNQTTQIARETSIRDQIGALSGPATGSTNWLLTDVRTALLGTLTVGTHAVTQSGSWTVNLGTLNGAATSAKQDAMLAALGTPVQAGATISNVVQAVATDRGAIVGTSAVQLMAVNALRRGLSIQVQSASASCYINGTTGATADFHSLQIGPSGYFEPDHHVGTGAISIICTAGSTSVYAREW